VSKIFSPERNILMPDYQRASEGGAELEDRHHVPRYCIQEWCWRHKDFFPNRGGNAFFS
jgi:hypothetical protein